VCHLESALGISQPNCSRQLGILKAAGIVDSRRDGTWVYYRIIDQEHDSVTSVLAVLARTFGSERALRADHTRLKKGCGPDACK
jgi:ArsR family transcriptional regulator